MYISKEKELVLLTVLRRVVVSIFLLLLCIIEMHCQSLKVKSFYLDEQDLTAHATSTMKCDFNGNLCALVKIEIVGDVVTCEGNIVGEVEKHTTSCFVYMCSKEPVSKDLTVKVEGFLPLHITFADYGYKELIGGRTYVLVLSSEQVNYNHEDFRNKLLAQLADSTLQVGDAESKEEFFNLSRIAAKKGDLLAEIRVGICYSQGIGTERNDSAAFFWYKKAADRGSVESLSYIAYAYQEGLGVSVDKQKAFTLYKQAALRGDVNAMYVLGCEYLCGYHIAKDVNKAIILLRFSAEKGNFASQFELGNCYYHGNGVEQNYSEAVKWYEKSSNQGYENAQCNLGNCYFYGYGVEKNLEKAADYWELSANQGYAAAQYDLGFVYESGSGRLKDMEKAIRWYKKAANQGFEWAIDALKRLNVK